MGKSYYNSVRDITWTGAIRCALHQVDVGTCTSDTWTLALVQVTHGHLTKWLPKFSTWPSAFRDYNR